MIALLQGLELLRILQVVFGIGLVVFVHELGHYLAARLCGVRVETFSLGFGPRLLAWKRGATVYQIALIPLGGFCRMAGEENRYGELPPAPDELPAKSVEQRFFIYVAGVAMNVAFVLVVFPIIFRIGVPFYEPRIGRLDPGGPAWRAGVQPGEEVLAVNGNPVFKFQQVHSEVALGSSERTELLLRDPTTGAERTVAFAPEWDPEQGFHSAGILLFPPLAGGSAQPLLEVVPDTPAWEAGLRTDMRLLGIVGSDPWLEPEEQFSQALERGGPIEFRVLDGEAERSLVVRPESVEGVVPRIGVRPPHNRIVGLRDHPLVERAGLREADRVLAVAGRPVHRVGDFRRHLRAAYGGELVLDLLRDGEAHSLALADWTLEELDELAANVALTLDVDTSALVVREQEAGFAAGLRDGDIVREIDGVPIARWRDVSELVKRAALESRAAVMAIERPGQGGAPPSYPTIEVRPALPQVASYGVDFRLAQYTYRAESIGEAVRFGMYSSWKLVTELWLSLKALVTAEISTENMGGIIAISQYSYQVAESGWPKFFFFLCFISMNLAFVNLLPIPVLDGGHLFFLIIEKIKGSPVSERVLGYSQMVGVVLILSLMIYVTYNDLARVFSN